MDDDPTSEDEHLTRDPWVRALAAGLAARDLNKRALRATKWSQAVLAESSEIVGRARSATLARAGDGTPDPQLEELWLTYASLGGDRTLGQIMLHLDGTQPLPTIERDILAHAAREVYAAPDDLPDDA